MTQTIDGVWGTYWQSTTDGTNSVSVQYDLGASYNISSVQVGWYQGNTRSTHFDIDTSPDGVNWTTVLSGVNSSGTTTGLETYNFPSPVNTEFVQIVCYGTSIDNVNAIDEVQINGQ